MSLYGKWVQKAFPTTTRVQFRWSVLPLYEHGEIFFSEKWNVANATFKIFGFGGFTVDEMIFQMLKYAITFGAQFHSGGAFMWLSMSSKSIVVSTPLWTCLPNHPGIFMLESDMGILWMLLIVVFPTVWAKQIGDVWFMSLSMSCQIVAGSKCFTTALFIRFWVWLCVTSKIRLGWVRVPTCITYILDWLRYFFLVVNKTAIHFPLQNFSHWKHVDSLYFD